MSPLRWLDWAAAAVMAASLAVPVAAAADGAAFHWLDRTNLVLGVAVAVIGAALRPFLQVLPEARRNAPHPPAAGAAGPSLSRRERVGEPGVTPGEPGEGVSDRVGMHDHFFACQPGAEPLASEAPPRRHPVGP